MRSGVATFKRARDLRRALTRPELVLWDQLRGKQLAQLRFRRQHPVGPFILDFYCPSAKLCVEVDGAAHGFVSQAHHDQARDDWLADRGIRVLRFTAKDILDPGSLDGVLRSIAAEAAPSTGFAGPPPP